MNTSKQIAKHLREVFLGGNWTATHLKIVLSDITWQQATTNVYSFNTIATLTYHISYYIDEVLKVFNGKELKAKDELSFDHPSIKSEKDWQQLLNTIWKNVEEFANLIEKLPENKLYEYFTDEKYGIYYRNLHGIIEHTHYHLGQIVIIKKFLLERNKTELAK